MGWREDIIQALQNLGGEAVLADIYRETRKIRTASGQSIPEAFDQTVQGTLERNSSSSENWRPGTLDVFQKVDRGRWAIRKNPPNLPSIGGIPADITPEDVIQALQDLDAGIEHDFGDSTRFDLVHEGKRYPPKAVIGLAARRALGRPMKPSEFSGGESSASFQVLRILGFVIVRKPGMAEMPAAPPNAIWIENTKTSHNHGGLGWEFGTCIWSPSADSRGGDRYAPMRLVQAGDLVIHVNDSELVGFSYAEGPYQEVTTPPPEPGDWGGRPAYYKVPLRDYSEFPKKVSLSDFLNRYRDAIRAEIEEDHPSRFLFIKEDSGMLRTVQGGYLTRCTNRTYTHIREHVYGLSTCDVEHGPLCLLGSGTGGEWVEKAQELIREKGGWASWWSFVLLEDAEKDLTKPFHLYINSGKGKFATRWTCADARSVRGSMGMPTPWPEITFPEELNRTRLGEGQNNLFKTWFKVTAIETIDPPLSRDDFIPASPWSRPESLLNQNAFGYAYRLPQAKIDGPVASQIDWEPYSLEDAIKNVFITPDLMNEMLLLLETKKNLILQGSPGVGKTFIAQRLAYALCGLKSDHHVEMVQFHQSYTYEDFIQGFRPRESGGFTRKDGVFYRFCERARKDPNSKYVFVIDEINRGNLSKIFGELMLLIESDKRGPDWTVSLTYSDERSPKFFVPKNVYLLGMMNTADRSLALVDYALRRRFAFVTIPPAFSQEAFTEHLAAQGVPGIFAQKIMSQLSNLNKMIADDRDLGEGFQIGHSYFCARDPQQPVEQWYERVIQTEIAPLLREYWFDKKKEELQEIVDALS